MRVGEKTRNKRREEVKQEWGKTINKKKKGEEKNKMRWKREIKWTEEKQEGNE